MSNGESQDLNNQKTPRGSARPSSASQGRKPTKTTTQVPFNLRSATLHESYSDSRKTEMTESERKEAEARNFKARPVSRGVYKPFVPVKQTKVTEMKPMVLKSDSRSEERAKYEEARRQKEAEMEKQKEEEMRLQAEAEAETVRNLRVQQQFKARKLPDFSSPWSPETKSAKGEFQMHDWHTIMDRRKEKRETEKEREARLKAMQLRESMKFKAREMPDFSRPWDARKEERRFSGPQEFLARRNLVRMSLDGRQWGQFSPREVTSPI